MRRPEYPVTVSAIVSLERSASFVRELRCQHDQRLIVEKENNLTEITKLEDLQGTVLAAISSR